MARVRPEPEPRAAPPKRVLIIGAGVCGLTAARALVGCEGVAEITVVDRALEAGTGCSWGPAALLIFDLLPTFGSSILRSARSFSVRGLLRSPCKTFRALRALMREPRLASPEGRRFRRECGEAWLQWLPKLAPATRSNVRLEGVSMLLRTRKQLKRARRFAATRPDLRLDMAPRSGALGRGTCAALITEQGGFVEPASFCRDLSAELRSLGARVRFSVGVEGIEPPAGGVGAPVRVRLQGEQQWHEEYDEVIICGGAYAHGLLRSVGTREGADAASRLLPVIGWSTNTMASGSEALDVPGGKGSVVVGDSTMFFRRQTADDEGTALDDGAVRFAGGVRLDVRGSRAPPREDELLRWAMRAVPRHCTKMGTWDGLTNGCISGTVWAGARPISLPCPGRPSSWLPEVRRIAPGVVYSGGGGFAGFINAWEGARRARDIVLS